MPDLIGTTLGPYRILEPIGLGGMAVVYKAYQPGMNRLVALKVLPAHYAQNPLFLQRFELEARVIARLEHPNIVPTYDFGQQDGVTYLVMRYLQAGTVRDLLAHGPLPLPDAAHLVAQVAAALDYAHAQSTIHRDVKPSNVLVDRQSHAYLTDFGLAKVLEAAAELTGSGEMVGTAAYMAPEQTLGWPVSPQTDVYSLGITLFEMVTGRPPFEGDTAATVALMHVHAPLPWPRQINPQLSEAVERVILNAAAKVPEDRFPSAGALARALAEAAGAESQSTSARLAQLAGEVAAERSSDEVTVDLRQVIRRQEWAERLTRLRRWAPGAASVLLIAALALAVFLAWRQTAQVRTSAAQTATAVSGALQELWSLRTAIAGGGGAELEPSEQALQSLLTGLPVAETGIPTASATPSRTAPQPTPTGTLTPQITPTPAATRTRTPAPRASPTATQALPPTGTAPAPTDVPLPRTATATPAPPTASTTPAPASATPSATPSPTNTPVLPIPTLTITPPLPLPTLPTLPFPGTK